MMKSTSVTKSFPHCETTAAAAPRTAQVSSTGYLPDWDRILGRQLSGSDFSISGLCAPQPSLSHSICRVRNFTMRAQIVGAVHSDPLFGPCSL